MISYIYIYTISRKSSNIGNMSKRSPNLKNKTPAKPKISKIKPLEKLSQRSRRASKKKPVKITPTASFDEEEFVSYDDQESSAETLIENLSGNLKFHIFNPDKYKIDSHKNMIVVPADHRKTSEMLTEYEYTEVISHRAKQIENNSPVYIDIGNETDPVIMAEKEIKARKCPLAIRRELNGLVCEIWDVNECTLP